MGGRSICIVKPQFPFLQWATSVLCMFGSESDHFSSSTISPACASVSLFVKQSALLNAPHRVIVEVKIVKGLVHEVGAGCWCCPHGPHTHPGVLGTTLAAPGHRARCIGHPFCFGGWSFLPQASASHCVISQCRHVQPAFSPGVLLLLLCSDLCCCLMSPALLVSPPEASFDHPKAAVKCHPQSFPALAVRSRHFSQSTRVWKQNVPSEPCE